MRKIILTALLLPLIASAAGKLPPEVDAALQFNKWYISQIMSDKQPEADYAALGKYVTRDTIHKLEAMDKLDPNEYDVPDVDMFIKSQDYYDDWGVVSMPRDVSEEIFDLFDRRKHNSAMILTSNRDVEEWPQVFSDPILASAAIDRMFEAANICIFQGPSHRMKGRINFTEIDND